MSDTTGLDRPRVTDNDIGEIFITFNGTTVRSYSYENDRARRLKMTYAREYIEGWCDGHEVGHDVGYDHGYEEGKE
jgi:hypothetical protein